MFLPRSRRRLAPADSVMVVTDELPDVAPEVDPMAGVRHGKLRLHEAWRFPEVWVDVPRRYALSRPRGPRTGLRFYLPGGGEYRESSADASTGGRSGRC